MSYRIAIVGMACRYPDAGSPQQLWENVLAGRRAFRRLPDERMRQADYYSPDPAAPDRFYSPKAAVLEGFEFDRVTYRVAGSTFRSTDLTHWLALDTAAHALADAGFPNGDGLSRTSTGVIVGNSLTGEFSRANLMRLRWPYVRRTVAAALAEQGWTEEHLGPFLATLEQRYKAPFPGIDEDTLAGGLSNTIAGRICNYFDLKGGGYTVDGACSSSLLSVARACESLVEGDIDFAVAGGVDLSIDPFEVIGFAKTGALATGEMRVYDKGSNGFWPGEGCGMLVLMREEDARAQDKQIYAVVAGWGISSDGKGGITRPEAGGHRLAIERAYRRAGFGMDTVSYFEGHGTGTAVGDATELKAISGARRTANPDAPPAAISTIKGNMGHTKAAAGVVALIKATLAVHHQVIPPATSHYDPHPELLGDRPALRVPLQAEPWPEGTTVRAGVSSMGFGGINTHVVVEHPGGTGRTELDERTSILVSSRQDVELLMLDAADLAELRGRIAQLAELAPRLAYAELTDLAGSLQQQLADRPLRAAVLASSPEQAEQRLTKLLTLLDSGARSVLDATQGIFFGYATRPPRIGYLFPGQGSGRTVGGALRRRFREVDELYRRAALPTDGDHVATNVAQPRIVTASAAGLRVLSALGIEAEVAAGHSLGEFTALHWAGAMDEDALLRIAAVRGRVMAEASREPGTMASIAAGPDLVEPLIAGHPVTVAGYNGPRQTVVSGPVAAVAEVCSRAEAQGLSCTRLSVSHAFHSPLVMPAADALSEYLGSEPFQPVTRRMMSTVTGAELASNVDIPALLHRQVLDPVRFVEAAAAVAAHCDLLLEVGPGRVLAGLANEIAPAVPALSLDTDSRSLAGLLGAVAAAFVLGTPVRHAELFAGRLVRALPTELRFLSSPCESAPDIDVAAGQAVLVPAAQGVAGAPPLPMAARPAPAAVSWSNGASSGAANGAPAPAPPNGAGPAADDHNLNTLELLRKLAAERSELPLEAVQADSLPLDDLHLSSITVGQIMNQITSTMGRPVLSATSSFATATLRELAELVDELADTAQSGADVQPGGVPGVTPWVRSLSLELVPEQRTAAAAGSPGSWQVFASDGHPLAEPLRMALEGAGVGAGVLLCLPADCTEDQVGLFLASGRATLAGTEPTRFVVVQHGRGASGLAKTLHLESPAVPTTLVDLPEQLWTNPEAVGWVVGDVAATSEFSEVRYDPDGTRRVPVLRPVPIPAGEPGPTPLGAEDVLLVTGGGKGITAECALAVARDTGAAIALLGRSDPAEDRELAGNLGRMTYAGVRHHYVRADVTSPEQVRAAVAEVRGMLGPVTAVLHGAGRNEPKPVTSLEEADFERTLAPKITGLRAVLDAVDPAEVGLLVTFGSIIGRAGLRGEAHYATANDWLTELALEWGREHEHCRVLALEWSVWAGVGMGERLGVVEALMRDGITPIPTDEGIAVLRQVLADPTIGPVLVVTGRAEGLPTIRLEQRELPLLRFLDQPRVHYPGIELVADAELSAGSDPYLEDHLLDGDLLFPAVIGMEAMTQVAAAVGAATGVPMLENVEFLRPIVVPVDGSVTVRVAALVRDEHTVDAVIRSSETGFAADHFRATLRFPRPTPPQTEGMAERGMDLAPVPVDPARELYGGMLFQGKRFQRLQGYQRIRAKECDAVVSTAQTDPWFGAFLPQSLVLADPGTRDTMMHAIQCCVPNATLLPAGLERLYLAEVGDGAASDVILHATERSRTGDTFVYDLDIRDAAGAVVERWEGLRLQAVRKKDGRGPWVPVLLGPYLERALAEVFPGVELAVVVEPADPGVGDDPFGGSTGDSPAGDTAAGDTAAGDTAAGDTAAGDSPAGDTAAGDTAGRDRAQQARRALTERALGHALGRPDALLHRPDGKPEVADGTPVSASHGAGLTFLVAGPGVLGADVELVQDRSEPDWAGLLWPEALDLRPLISRETGEDSSLTATRLWGAVECIRKAGFMQAPITVDSCTSDGWVVLAVGDRRVATWATTLAEQASPVVFALLIEGRS